MDVSRPVRTVDAGLRLAVALELLRVRGMLGLRGLNGFLEAQAYERTTVPVRAVSDPSAASAEAMALGRLVQETARVLPGTRRCLVQAVATALLLRRRGHEHAVLVGARARDRELLAHAWVTSRGAVVVGEGELTALPVLVAFRPRRSDSGGRPST